MNEESQLNSESGGSAPQDTTAINSPIRGAGKGSFWIPPDAVALLLENKATAVDIAAYLVLARFTGPEGKFSTAGLKAVKKAVGIGDDMAEAAIDRMLQMTRLEWRPSHRSPTRMRGTNLLFRTESWATEKKEAVPTAATVKSQVRWVLNDFDRRPSEGVWFGNALVDGFGRFHRPLLELKRCGDVAARLLLRFHQANDMMEYGGVRPRENVYRKYDTACLANFNAYNVWHGADAGQWAFNALSGPCLGCDEAQVSKDKNPEAMKPFWLALQALEACGFIYEIVTVLDADPDKPESLPIYNLKAKNRHGDPPKGEEGLAGETARLAGLLGFPVTDKTGRFYGKYAAIVPSYITQPHIAGIYRLRFRVANPKNYGVKESWGQLHARQREAEGWLAEVKHLLEFQRSKT